MEVIDLRSIKPLDSETILSSVRKTGRLVVVDVAPAICGVAAEVMAIVAEHAFTALRAPIIRLAAPDVPVPYSIELEQLMYPTTETITAAVRRLCALPSRA